MTRQQQRIGKHGQNIAASVLSGLGLERVTQIGTPVRLIKMGSVRSVPVFQVIFGDKVSGDHTAIWRGKFVLIETKTILDNNLVWSDFREHQPDELADHAAKGGISLVVWIHSTGKYVMRFPIEGFGKGKGITPERARELDSQTRMFLRE